MSAEDDGGGPGGGFTAGRAGGFFGLDSFGLAQYVCLHGVCFPNVFYLGRESHNLWLGTVHAAQPTFTPESRHLFHFHRQPYCLGNIRAMKRLRSLLAPILAFVIGLIIGGAVTAYVGFRLAHTYLTDSSLGGIGQNYALLQVLRTGDTNKVRDSLEMEMNGDIVQLADERRHVPVSKLKPSVIRVITQVRDYRAAHPYSMGDPKMDRFVGSILSLTNKTMWPNTSLEATATVHRSSTMR